MKRSIEIILYKNNIDIGNTDLDLCKQIYQLGKLYKKKEIQNQIWHEMNETPKIRINKSLCILTKYGDIYEIETVSNSDFEEFISNHDCLKWAYLDVLVNKTTPMEYKIV